MTDKEKEVKEEESTEEKKVNTGEYTDEGVEPEKEEAESKEKESGEITKTTIDAFSEILSTNLPEYQKQQFKDSFEQLGTPMADLAGVEDTYPKTIEKMKQFLPGPVRIVLGITGLTISGLFIKKQITGNTFKQEIRSTMGIVNKKQTQAQQAQQRQAQAQQAQAQESENWKDVE